MWLNGGLSGRFAARDCGAFAPDGHCAIQTSKFVLFVFHVFTFAYCCHKGKKHFDLWAKMGMTHHEVMEFP